MSEFDSRLFAAEAQHLLPSEIRTGTSDAAINARLLLADIGYDLESRANKVMLLVSDAARNASALAPEPVQQALKGAGFGLNTHDSRKGSHQGGCGDQDGVDQDGTGGAWRGGGSL